MPEEKELEWRSKPEQEADEIRRVNREQDEKYADSFDRQWETPEQPENAGKEPRVPSQRTKAQSPRRRSNNPRSNNQRGNNQRSNSRSNQRSNSRQPARKRSKSPQDVEQLQTPRRRPAVQETPAAKPAAPRRAAFVELSSEPRADYVRVSEEYPLPRIVLIILAAFGVGMLLGLVGIVVFRSCAADTPDMPETSVYETQTDYQETTTQTDLPETTTQSVSTLSTQTQTATESTVTEISQTTVSNTVRTIDPKIWGNTTVNTYEFPDRVAPNV